MANIVPIPTIAGLLTGYVGNLGDIPIAIPATGDLTGVEFIVADAPSGGTVVVELRTAAGGGGSAIQATIADGVRVGSATGTVPVVAGNDLFLRIVSESGSALNLSGYFEIATTATVPGAATELTTLANVKLHLGIISTAFDTELSLVVSSVSDKMRKWMGREITEVVTTGELHHGGQSFIFLKHYPVTAMTALTEDGTALVDGTDFYTETNAGVLERLSSGVTGTWLNKRRTVSVDYTAGYVTVPWSLQLAAMEECGLAFKQWNLGGDRLGERNKALDTGGQTVYDPASFLPQTIEAMRPYRRMDA